MRARGKEEEPEVMRIIGRADIEAAFSVKDIGDHGLSARVEEVKVFEDAEPVDPPMLLVSGNFVDRVGKVCGKYERFIYRNDQAGELEVALRSLEVDENRRGGVGHQFRERSFTALRRAGIRRVRAYGGGSAGTYTLARDGFDIAVAGLPGFGADELIAPGDVPRPLPRQGDLVHILVERLIDAAVRDGRISEFEADWVRAYKPRSSPALADFPLRHLSRRLLHHAFYPQVREI